MTPLETAFAAIDDANAKDPNATEGTPDALLYGQRMTEQQERLFPNASAPLKIAARGQHIERWILTRADYPEGREGYLTWRRDLACHHADRVGGIMLEAGFGDADIEHVGRMLRKEGIKRDADVQALEDVICFTFLQWYFQPFSTKHSEEKLLRIVQKTARKMSADARARALQEFDLPAPYAEALTFDFVDIRTNAGQKSMTWLPIHLNTFITAGIGVCQPGAEMGRKSGEQVHRPAVIIVSHGQPSDPLPAEADLSALATRVADEMPDWHVGSATLANPGALDAALAASRGVPFVYPLFMTDGWFVRSALPDRLGEAKAHILPPLGVAHGLPDLVAQVLHQELEARGWTAAETHLCIASHGSGRSPKSKEATEAFVTRLRDKMKFAEIRTGYVEEAPFFADVVRHSPDQALCLPFFAAYGGHVKEDITDALAAAAFKGALLNPIGTFDEIPAFIAHALRHAGEMQDA